MSDVSFEIIGDEVIITKHADTEEAHATVAAIRRAVELFNKNDSDMTPGAYGPEGDDDEENDDDELDADETDQAAGGCTVGGAAAGTGRERRANSGN